MSNIDLTLRPPRSMRVRLGRYVILPRLLDKCRADIAGTSGEYHYNCPIDQYFFTFVGIDAEEFKSLVASGKGDGEIQEWIGANAKKPRDQWEIAAWSQFHETRSVDSDAEALAWYAESIGKLTTTREDIRTIADFLDLDDYVTFGGKA